MNRKWAVLLIQTACFFIFFHSIAYALTPNLELQRLNAQEKARNAKLWQDKYWQKLLYYEKSLFSYTKSKESNTDFFISKHGAISPKLELEAEINGLFFEGVSDNSPECNFPERYNWLRKKLQDLKAEIPDKRFCPSFEEWKNRLNVDNASLIFAGSYLNNPSSSYGHTFLRLHKKNSKGAELLDYTLNYAAETSDELGLFYAVKGLLGLYPGMFTTTPYYIKIQEYTNDGNRDLWEFDLKLNQNEIDKLARLAWEMGKFNYPYFFFSKNCSWALLPFLEIIRPSTKLVSKFNVAVIPSDSAKVIAKAFNSTTPKFRPSLMTIVHWKRAQLSHEEKKAAYKISSIKKQKAGLSEIAVLPANRQAAILEYSGDYISWLARAGKINKQENNMLTMPILAYRAKLGPQETFIGAPVQPKSILDAHESFRFSAGAIFHKKGPSYELGLRGALQDLLDNPDGYLQDAELEMLNLRFRYTPKTGRLYLNDSTLAKVTSLNPWSLWERQKSWAVSAGLAQATETGKKDGNALIGDISVSAGYSTLLPVKVRTLAYLLANLDTGFGPALGNDNYRIGAGAIIGTTISKGAFRFSAQAQYNSYFLGYSKPLWQGQIGSSYPLSKNTAIRAVYNWRKNSNEIGFYITQFVPAP